MTLKSHDDLRVLVDRLFRERASWPELVKQIRAASGADIFTAEKIALSHDGWRRLCNYRIKHEPACRKQAAWHAKRHGPNALIVAVGEGFVVIEAKLF